MLAITGHTFHDLIGTNFQQDVDLDKLFMDVAAYNQRIMGPAHVDNVMDEAIRTALARHTVAHVTIPKDIQEWKSSDAQRSNMNVKEHSRNIYVASHPHPPQQQLQKAADIINHGSKVAILVGRGALGCGKEMLPTLPICLALRSSKPYSEKLCCRTTAHLLPAALAC